MVRIDLPSLTHNLITPETKTLEFLPPLFQRRPIVLVGDVWQSKFRHDRRLEQMNNIPLVRCALIAAVAAGAMGMASCRHEPPEITAPPSLVIDVPSSELSIRLDDRATLAFLYVPPGHFQMGSSADEADRFPDETAHSVTITRGFYLTETEVTQAQWYAIMGTEPSYLSGANRPVEHISYEAAMVFCRKLSQATGVIRMSMS